MGKHLLITLIQALVCPAAQAPLPVLGGERGAGPSCTHCCEGAQELQGLVLSARDRPRVSLGGGLPSRAGPWLLSGRVAGAGGEGLPALPQLRLLWFL